jgi:hypothetical protein
MPLQTIKASKGYATGHVRDNMWLWIGIFAVITAAAAFLRWNAGHPGIWGDIMAFAGMVTGILVVVKSQQGFVSMHAPPEDEALIRSEQA